MHIQFIGTSDGYPTAERYCSCTVVTVKGCHYVIDAGISLYSMLLKYKMNPSDTRAIFITHMHGDHTNGLIEYANMMTWGSGKNLNTRIFMPTKIGKIALQNMIQAQDFGREIPIDVFSEGPIYEDENVKVTAFRTRHNDNSFGFLIEGEGKRVYFTGDMSSTISEMPEFLKTEKTDAVICESAHNKLYECTDILNSLNTDKIIINHIAQKHSLDDFEKAKPVIRNNFILAFDGMEISDL